MVTGALLLAALAGDPAGLAERVEQLERHVWTLETVQDVSRNTGRLPVDGRSRRWWRTLYCVPVTDLLPGDVLVVTAHAHVTSIQPRRRGVAVAWSTDISFGPDCYHGGTRRARLTRPWWRLAQPSGQNVTPQGHHSRVTRTVTWTVPQDALVDGYVRVMGIAASTRRRRGDILRVDQQGGLWVQIWRRGL